MNVDTQGELLCVRGLWFLDRTAERPKRYVGMNPASEGFDDRGANEARAAGIRLVLQRGRC